MVVSLRVWSLILHVLCGSNFQARRGEQFLFPTHSLAGGRVAHSSLDWHSKGDCDLAATSTHPVKAAGIPQLVIMPYGTLGIIPEWP